MEELSRPLSNNFNPRPREGSDCAIDHCDTCSAEFQSTPPRGERRKYKIVPYLLCNISIHAPARGATEVTAEFVNVHRISIHAPARGATKFSLNTIQGVLISIHAPARGATELVDLIDYISKISIHAPARGATTIKDRVTAVVIFQSTPPRGERLKKTGLKSF